MISLLIPLFGSSVSATAWHLSVSGSAAEVINSCALAPDGGFILAGSTASEGAGSSDAWLAKVSRSGSIEWQRRIGGTGFDAFNAAAVDGSGNIYAVGQTSSAGTGGDGLMCKYSSSGTLLWQERWGYSSGSDIFFSAACDSAGNLIIAGRSESGPAGGNDHVLLKVNGSGVSQWVRFVGGTLTEGGGGAGVAVDSGDNIYLSGDTASAGGGGGSDLFIAKFNSAGTIQWQRSLGGAGDEAGVAIAVDPSGNSYVVGRTASTGGAGGSDLLICKYNTSGVIQWQRSIGAANHDAGAGVAVGSDGFIYAVGSTDPGSSSIYDILICKYDASGTIQWQRAFATSNNDSGADVVIDAAGHLVLVGSSGSPQDGIVARLPTDGSKTGTYGAWTYAAASRTEQSRALTDQARTLTVTTSSGGEAVTTLTEAAAARTTTLVEIA